MTYGDACLPGTKSGAGALLIVTPAFHQRMVPGGLHLVALLRFNNAAAQSA